MLSILPNALTVIRGLIGPAVAGLVLLADAHTLAFWLFLTAILTDLCDGWVARALNAESALGKVLDPFADKVLNTSTWLALGLVGWAPWWLAGTMLLRDLAVGIGWFALGRPVPYATMSGRLKVSFEGVALPILLFRHDWLGVHWPSVGLVLGLCALVLSLVSSLAHLRIPAGSDNPGSPPRRTGVGAQP